MPFADPHACPSCAGPIAGEPRCPHCRFDLSSATARDIWLALQRADTLVAQGRRESLPPAPGSAATSPARRVTTGSVILGLGALCLVVAAMVFVTLSWRLLGPTGRTLVLSAVTAAVGVAAAWATRRPLRGSAETLWAVFFGLFAIDFFAARARGLIGLDALEVSWSVLLFGGIVAALGVAVTLLGRTMSLTVPPLAAGIAVWLAGFALVGAVSGPFFWSVAAGLLLSTLAVAAARALAIEVTVRTALPAVVVLYVAAVGGAIVELADSPHLEELARHGHGVPLLLMVLVTAAAGAVVRVLAVPAAGLVVLGLGALAITPAEAAWAHEGGFLAAAAIAVGASFALGHGTGPWFRGARTGMVLILATLAAASLGWLANAMDAVGRSNQLAFGSTWTVRLSNHTDVPGPGWLALVTFAALAITVFAVLRWPSLRGLPSGGAAAPMTVAAVGVVLGVIAFEPTVLLAALVTLTVAVAVAVVVRHAPGIWLAVALVLTVAPAFMTWASKPVSLLVWLLSVAALAGYGRYWRPDWARRAAAFGATLLLTAAAVQAAELGALDDQGLRLTAATTAVLLMVLVTGFLRRFVGRSAVEAAVALVLGLTLLSAVDTPAGPQSFLWTIVGAPLVVLGLVLPDRAVLRRVGSVLLGVAWILRLSASDVDLVEAYTAPFAVVLLASGWRAMRHDAQRRTRTTLLPGLALALLPSLPHALLDPASLRALVLGVVALIVLAHGVWRKWQLPFVFGASVLALVVLWNIAPVANGLPRWTLIALTGAILVGVGISWESRVRDTRLAVHYVSSMR